MRSRQWLVQHKLQMASKELETINKLINNDVN